MGKIDSDKERYSKISIEDDEEDVEEKSIFSKTLEIPKIMLAKRERKRREDYFNKAIRYNPNPEDGLNALQVDERMTNNLNNKQPKTLSKTYLQIIIDNVFTYFNILLITIGIVLISVGEYGNCFFLVIVGANTIIGLIQEIRAKQIVDKLHLMNIPEVTVRRDGIKQNIPTDQLVLDDIFYLFNGSEIPADSYIVRGEVEVNESMLTGESLPIKKVEGDYVLAGSFVVSGSCVCRLDRIGEHNYIAQLQNKARKVKKVKSVLLKTLNRLIKAISLIIVPLGVLLAFFNYSKLEGNVNETIVSTATTLVTMIPSGMFLLISTTLTVSVLALGQRKTMVQDSYAIESLARSNIICLDKTGTITDGTMQLEKEIVIDNKVGDVSSLMSSYLSAFNDSNVTSIALKKHYNQTGSYNINKTLPFSSDRKYSAVEFESVGTFVLGAPEFLVKDEELLKQVNSYNELGNRVLLLGKTKEKIKDGTSFKEINPVALFVLSDHIRDEAYDTVKWFKENNVQIRIISGDNPLTVSKIAEKVGVDNASKYISLDGLSNEEVIEIANDYVVFGRVSPEQKAVLIKTLKKLGNTVAMTGDGVNDILAMKQADCSIAMASGSEAARNASHLVLMDSNFASMPKVVEEGRKVINNIQRSASLFLMKTLYAMAMAVINLIVYQPLQLTHLYILEFAVIGLPSFFLALQPNTALISGSFLKNVLFKSLPGGLALLFAVGSMMILEPIPYFEILSRDMMSSMACVALSITGLFILFRICSPFNIYRGVLFASMVLISLVLVALFPNILAIDLSVLTLKNWATIIVVAIIAMGFYTLVDVLRTHYVKKHEKTNI